MTRSSRKKETYCNSSELPNDSCTEETAARTRPFSFDDIMLKRKHKRKPADVEEVIEGARLIGKSINEVSIASDSHKKRSKDSVCYEEKHASEYFVKVSSRKKEVDTSLDEGKLLNAKNRESHRYERKSKTSLRQSNFVDRSKGSETSEQEHEKRSNWFRFNDSEKEHDRRHSRDRVEKDKHANRYGGTEKESKRKHRKEDDESTRNKNEVKKHDSHRWRESEPEEKREKKQLSKVHNEDDERTRDKNEVKKHDSYRCRESEPKEKRENKELSKVLNEDDERTRDKNEVKKHDSYKWRENESKEKRERKESSKVPKEDSRMKRRRSRSRDHAKDTGRRSTSLSPRAHKRVSHAVHNHGDLSTHTSKDRSGRSNPDFDCMRMSSNGSSGQNRRHSSSASKLGGYSPRKRRTEAAAKTPSPTIRSPEKRSAGWDRPPAKSVNIFNGSVLSSSQSSLQMVSSDIPDVSKIVPATSNMAVTAVGVTYSAFSPKQDTTADSVQLTQATRPSRRLYVQNLPAATSEESLMKCINNFIPSSGGHHTQGSHPCISCIINKEKNQALVEFLTPEDASAALSFDGETFEGSIVKVRRPKDFVDASTGKPRKSLAEVGLISKDVKDSPYKIFIGGISTSISSDMLMEIACAFGPLRAYRYEFNADLREPCVFLEYVNQSITNRACAGLNGMKLGGKVLTVVQAMQNASLIENVENPPSYEIPSHAKPLLEKPTQVLKLKNVIDPQYLPLISEPELEEMLEDIRVQCARFGTIKSVNIMKAKNLSITPQAYEPQLNEIGNIVSAMDGENLDYDDSKTGAEVDLGSGHPNSEELSRSEPLNSRNEFGELTTDVDRNSKYDDKLNVMELSNSAMNTGNGDETVVKNSTCEDKFVEVCQPGQVDDEKAIEDCACQESSCGRSMKIFNNFNTSPGESDIHNDTVDDNSKKELLQVESSGLSSKEDTNLTEKMRLDGASSDLGHSLRKQLDGVEKDAKREHESDRGDVFELASVLVEFRRTEASCMAAHGLHGRLYDERIITVGYVSLDSYKERFPV